MTPMFTVAAHISHTWSFCSEHWEFELSAEGGDSRMRTGSQGHWRPWHWLPPGQADALRAACAAGWAEPSLGERRPTLAVDGQALSLTLQGPGPAPPVVDSIPMSLSRREPGTGPDFPPLLSLALQVMDTDWPDKATLENNGWRGDRKPPAPGKVGPPVAMLAAFDVGHYTVWLDDHPVALRVGEPQPRLARLMAEHGVTEAALLTADNPFGQPRPDADNARGRESLEQLLSAARCTHLPGECASAEGQWREPARLCLGLAAAQARGLAEWFQQAAWLHIDATGTPRLEACRYYPPNRHWHPQWPAIVADALDSPLDPAFAGMTRPAWPRRSLTGSVILPLPEAAWNDRDTVINLPEASLSPKRELHLTLLSTREAAELAERLDVAAWQQAFEAQHWTLEPTGRACLLHDTKDGRPIHSVIAVVDCPALNRFRAALAQASGVELADTLAHVSLYDTHRSIGLSSLAEFEARLVRDLTASECGRLMRKTIFEAEGEVA